MAEEEEFTRLLQGEIEGLLVSLSNNPDLYNLVREPLTVTSRGLSLSAYNERSWPILPLIVSEAICNSYEQVLPAAAAFQFLLAAGDVFDDIEDADSTDSVYAKYGLSVAVGVASTLLIVGENSLTQLRARGVGADTVVRVMEVVNSYYTQACIGQHMDLTTEVFPAESEDMYMKIIRMKSASQVECACCVGALLAGANQKLIDAFTILGHNLGMMSQIGNDIQGIVGGRDITKRKITLPVIYGLNLSDSSINGELMAIFHKHSTPVHDYESIKQLLFHIGAMHYATIKLNVYKQKAIDILLDIQESGIDIEKLRSFLL
jgi:geranylgeranyl pyrophosphate synthase